MKSPKQTTHVPFATTDFETDVAEHWRRIPEAERTDKNLAFHRFYFKDAAAANGSVAALIAAGGYAVAIGNSVRVCRFWESLVKSIGGQWPNEEESK